jgi:hypothetical protein
MVLYIRDLVTARSRLALDVIFLGFFSPCASHRVGVALETGASPATVEIALRGVRSSRVDWLSLLSFWQMSRKKRRDRDAG